MGFNNVSQDNSRTVNSAGGIAYKYKDNEKLLLAIVMNSLFAKDDFYETKGERFENVRKLVTKNANDEAFMRFVAKTSIFVRNQANLRSISHVLNFALIENVKNSSFLRKSLLETFNRPDDMIEVAALWFQNHKDVMLPNVFKRAVKDALESKFDAYQLKKYAMESREVKLKDLVKLARPNTKNFEDKNIFKNLIESKLDKIKTMQTGLSDGGEGLQVFHDLLKEKKLGYMAAVKNIRQVFLTDADGKLQDKLQSKRKNTEIDIQAETIKMFCDFITNEKAIKNSKMLPFRFYQAWDAIQGLSVDKIKLKTVKAALETAFMYSAKNLEIVQKGETSAFLLDESGSMGDDIKSPFNFGKCIIAALQKNVDEYNTLFYTWADQSTERDVSKQSPFDFIRNTKTRGGGTDVAAPLKELIRTKTKLDKLIILTDMQLYDTQGNTGYGIGRTFEQYLAEYKKISPNVKVIFWNLNGYGTGTPCRMTKDVFCVDGMSDKVIEYAPKMWDNPNFIVDMINGIKLGDEVAKENLKEKVTVVKEEVKKVPKKEVKTEEIATEKVEKPVVRTRKRKV